MRLIKVRNFYINPGKIIYIGNLVVDKKRGDNYTIYMVEGLNIEVNEEEIPREQFVSECNEDEIEISGIIDGIKIPMPV